jgi:vacuolar-type H+-ATPase subunit H
VTDHDIDPTTATTMDELAACMRRLRARADNISYRDLEKWGDENGRQLPRTTLLEVLHGRRFPRKRLLLGFVAACGVDPARDTRWEQTWNRLNELTGDAEPTASTESADLDTTAHDPAAGTDEAVPAEVWDKATALLQQARRTAELEADGILDAARTKARAILTRAEADAAAIREAAERDALRISQDTERLRESALQDLVAELDERRRDDVGPRRGVSGRQKWRFGR